MKKKDLLIKENEKLKDALDFLCKVNIILLDELVKSLRKNQQNESKNIIK